ncbi:MAG TPA: TIGR04551 family protein, partial [Polyangia bacterium]
MTSLVFASLLGGAGMAQAQMGAMPGGMSPGGMTPPPQNEQKEEGPAEAAPEDEGKPATESKPESGYPNQRRRQTQILELDGYFRTRLNWLHNFNMGFGYADPNVPNSGNPPFPTPLECGTHSSGCAHNLGDTNMRLRLEPTINISDQVRVVAQIDVFDNLIYGSTPDSLLSASQPDLRTNQAQSSILSNSAVPPEYGQNSYVSAIRPKRVWGEVDSQLGSLRFGRMPWHFGRGIYFNKGDCQDCDGGTTVDRIMALTQVYGHQFALSWDFGPSGYTWGMTDAGRADPNGSPLDLSQNDEVVQFTAALTKVDDEQHFRERVANGDLVLNYGIQAVYRQQNNEVYKLTPTAKAAQAKNGTISRTDLSQDSDVPTSLTRNVNAWLVIPSLWFKLGWKALTLEFETTAQVGHIGNAGQLRLQEAGGGDTHLSILGVGWVLAANLHLYKDTLFIGLETGGATGDQAEAACKDTDCNANQLNPSPYLNYRWKFVPQPLGDSWQHNFYFSPEYHVDEIFFRRIMGTVNNAMYVKPSIAYWLDVTEGRQLGVAGSLIYSMAMSPVSTPGNSINYGVEMDLGLNYRNTSEKFYAGFVWGVFWPFGGLNHPTNIYTSGGAGNATASQIVRAFVG